MITIETKQKLTAWAEKYERPEFCDNDPIQFPRMFLPGGENHLPSLAPTQSVEAVAIITSWLSYGNRRKIVEVCQEVTNLLRQMSIIQIAMEHGCNKSRLYRFYRWNDLSSLCYRLHSTFHTYGSIGNYIRQSGMTPLKALIEQFGGITGMPKDDTSACKRLCMLLRWMVRTKSTVDLGIWFDIPTSELIIPLDTHVHRMAQELGLTKRQSADMTTALEITEALKEVFPDDPTRGDFALFGYGIEHSITNNNKTKTPRKRV